MLDTDRPKGLYCYEKPISYGDGRCWRPDLVPIAMEWLAGIDPQDLPYLSGVRSSMSGYMIVTFDVPRQTGRPVRITFSIEQGCSSMDNGHRVWTSEDRVVPYDTVVLHAAARLAPHS